MCQRARADSRAPFGRKASEAGEFGDGERVVVSKVFRVGQEESTSRSVALLDEGPDVGGLLREERRQEGGPGEGPWTGFPIPGSGSGGLAASPRP